MNSPLTPEAKAWRQLIDGVALSIHDCHNLPPTPSAVLAAIEVSPGRYLPPSLQSLYAETSGLSVSGYLPDIYDPSSSCTFSLIAAAEVPDWYKMMMTNHRPRGGLWPYFPHWLKACTVAADADGIWNFHWIPFATDGAAGVQFMKGSAIYQYDPGLFRIRRCAGSLASYLASVASRLQKRQLKIYDLRKFNITPSP